MRLYSETLKLADLQVVADRMGIQLREAADIVPVRAQPHVEFRLQPLTDVYRRFNKYGRRCAAVDSEGHYVFIKSLFDLDPAARLKSALADFDGVSDFAERGPALRGVTFGSS